jgi:hypothetical protein
MKIKILVFTQNIKNCQDIFSVFGGNIQCCVEFLNFFLYPLVLVLKLAFKNHIRSFILFLKITFTIYVKDINFFLIKNYLSHLQIS